MDGTVVAAALKPLATSFGAELSTVVWVTVGYLLAAATMLPLLGWAMARFGGRRVFLAGLVLFLIGSALASLAWSIESLIAFRVVQGFGGGLLEPTSLALAGALAPREKVGKVLGRMSAIINVAPLLGPLVGSALLRTGHWQWIFLVNIPFGLVVLAVAARALPAGRGEASAPRADVPGLALLTSGFLAVLYALSSFGASADWWPAAGFAVAGLALLGGYVRYALRTTRAPAFDLRLLRRPGFAPSLAVMSMVGLIMITQTAALPLIASERLGLHGIARGLPVAALGFGLLFSMSYGARMGDRTGPRPLVRLGSVLTAAGLATFALLSGRLPAPVAIGLFVLVGLTFGLTASPTFSGVFRILPPADQPQGTTALFMTVQLSGSLGVTLVGLFQARLDGHWVAGLFGLLTLAALAMTVLSRWLPGRPDATVPPTPQDVPADNNDAGNDKAANKAGKEAGSRAGANEGGNADAAPAGSDEGLVAATW
jgi:EmrB/QacA subfamily drug resistance transporter